MCGGGGGRGRERETSTCVSRCTVELLMFSCPKLHRGQQLIKHGAEDDLAEADVADGLSVCLAVKVHLASTVPSGNKNANQFTPRGMCRKK